MARYDYRCRICDERFEVQRPMAASAEVAPCPAGHLETVRVLSTFTTVGAMSSSSVSGGGGGGCCGGHCGCGH